MQSKQKPAHGQDDWCPHYGDRAPYSCPYCVAASRLDIDDTRQHRPEAVASSARTRDPELALTEAEFARARENLNPAPSLAAVGAPRPARNVAAAVLELLRLAELERLSRNERQRPPGRWWRYANRQRWTPAYKGDLAPANDAPAELPPVPFDVARRSTGRW